MTTATTQPHHDRPHHDPSAHRAPDGAGDRAADRARSGSDAPWLVVAGREIAVKLRDKGFIWSTVTTIAIMAIAIGVSLFMATKTETTTIAVADDEAAAVVEAAGAAPATGPGTTEYVVERVADPAAVDESVRSEAADVGLVHADGGWTLVGRDSVDAAVSAALTETVRTATLESNARDAGTSLEVLAAGSQVEERLLEGGEGSNEGVTYLAGFAFVFLFYMAAILFGYSIANSVVEEKQSRIVEILAAAIPLRQLLVGKIVGATVLALAQMTIFVGIGLVGLSFTEYSSMLPTIGAAAGWYLAFFVVGFVALAALFAVAGALATRTEDVQSTSSPLLMLVMFASFGGLVVDGAAKVVLSYLPVFSVVTMPLRLVAGEAAWWEPLVALALTVAFTAAVIVVAERLYRRSLMQTGGRLTYRQALALKD